MRDDHIQAALFRSSSSGHPAEEQLLTAEAQLAALEDSPAAEQVAAYAELHELLTVALARTAETGAAGSTVAAQSGAARARESEPSG